MSPRGESVQAIAIRDGRDGDAAELIELIDACWSEYPGCILDVDAEAPELRAIATDFAQRAGRFWVAERAARIVGCIGVVPAAESGGCELRKLYVAASERRRGLGGRLCALAEEEARSRGARFVELWTDTRFLDAHRLYARLGYVRGTATRELHDLSATIEVHFRKELDPVRGGPRRSSL